ncbi:AimP [Bacillus phage F16Ba]|uniref:AimP n=1 Tax=Bacillus phage F16Ba TaxID=2767194 RepID=A0ACD3VP76_9CAUD|nr:AimP [Bacillus phage F16Ba]UIE29671.1 AimP [Bacillus phage F16Ba]
MKNKKGLLILKKLVLAVCTLLTVLTVGLSYNENVQIDKKMQMVEIKPGG